MVINLESKNRKSTRIWQNKWKAATKVMADCSLSSCPIFLFSVVSCDCSLKLGSNLTFHNNILRKFF